MGALLLGERIPGITAAEWGLVWTCVVDEELSSTSEQIARKLASGPTAAYDLIKRMVRRQSAGGLRIAWMPAEIIMIDLDDNRLGLARQFGATQTINSSDSKAAEKVKAPTCRRGVGTAAIEAVGVPPTLLLCQELLTPSGGHSQYWCSRPKGRSASRNAVVAEYFHHDPTGSDANSEKTGDQK